jgi:hypothetical protein
MRSARGGTTVRWWVWALIPGVLGTGLLLWALDAWSRREPDLAPRHRAEALCFLLAQPPAFEPPMRVQPSAALVRGRFGAATPASFALRDMMHYSDDMMIREWSQNVGDFDVALLWLRLPGAETERHWLIVAWMEGADLAVCNFRFAGTSRHLSSEQALWGKRLLDRILTPDNFRRTQLPEVRLRPRDGATMPSFGPSRQT